MQTRPCLISASCNHLISISSERPHGSNPAYPIISSDRLAGLGRKGIAGDCSIRREERVGAGAEDRRAPQIDDELRVVARTPTAKPETNAVWTMVIVGESESE